MSDETTQNQDETPDELTLLKQRATALGVSFNPRIGLEALREKVRAAIEDDAKPAAEEAAAATETLSPMKRQMAIRQEMKREKTKLVRVRISCLNPAKAEWPGEIITVINKYMGSIKKFVPFGEQTDDGYHIPQVIYDELKARQFNQIKVRKDRTTGRDIITQRWVPEFNLEVLPPLTKEELAELATAQAAAGTVERHA